MFCHENSSDLVTQKFNREAELLVFFHRWETALLIGQIFTVSRLTLKQILFLGPSVIYQRGLQ